MRYDLLINGNDYTRVDTVKNPDASGSHVSFKPSGELRDYLNGNTTKIVLDDLITIIGNAFQNNKVITDVILQNVTTAGEGVFNGCASLTTVDLPNLTRATGNGFFFYCIKLKNVNLPKLETVGQQLFGSCSSLEEISLSKLSVADINMCSGCESLKKVDLGVCSSIKGAAFYNCLALESIILRSNTIVTIEDNSFGGNTSTTFRIYVPSSLVNEYKTNSKWSAFSERIFAIEGSEFEII